MRTHVRLSLVVAGLVSLAAPASAQSDSWQVTVSPYLMGASMSGNQVIRGRDVRVDVSASDVFSNLEFGAMGALVARKGNWGFGGDAIWMALGSTVDRPTAVVGALSADVDMNQGAFAFYGLRRLAAGADVTFGARVNTLQGEIEFKGPLGLRVDQSKTWVDPLAGLLLHTPPGSRVGLRVYSEIGGFGVGSDFVWQIFPTVTIGLGQRASLDFGYRWLDMDYEDGEGNERFAYDMLTQGPVVGFSFRF
jgi:hypothetical protein